MGRPEAARHQLVAVMRTDPGRTPDAFAGDDAAILMLPVIPRSFSALTTTCARAFARQTSGGVPNPG